MNLYDHKVSLLASINREQEILDNKINFLNLPISKINQNHKLYNMYI